MSLIIQKIRTELKSNIEDSAQKSFSGFFKEEVKYYGVRAQYIKKIAKKYWKEIKSLDKKEIFGLCEEKYNSDYLEKDLGA